MKASSWSSIRRRGNGRSSITAIAFEVCKGTATGINGESQKSSLEGRNPRKKAKGEGMGEKEIIQSYAASHAKGREESFQKRRGGTKDRNQCG